MESVSIQSDTKNKMLDKTLIIQEIINHNSAIYVMAVNSNIMSADGIVTGDQVVVDRSRMPVNGNIIIAKIGNDLCIRKILIEENRKTLVGSGIHISPLSMENNIFYWGVVIYVLKKMV
jgi:DNA polymerase V